MLRTTSKGTPTFCRSTVDMIGRVHIGIVLALGCAVAVGLGSEMYRLCKTAIDTEHSKYLMFAFQAGNIDEAMLLFDSAPRNAPSRDRESCVSLADRIYFLPFVLPSRNDDDIALGLRNAGEAVVRECRSLQVPRSRKRIADSANLQAQQQSLVTAIRGIRAEVGNRFPTTLATFDHLLLSGHPMLRRQLESE